MEECIKCHQKLAEEFFVKRKSPTKVCKKCINAYQRAHYQKNRQYYIDKSTRGRAVYVKRNVEFLISYCKTHPCVDCGETDFIVLEFDHVRGKKLNNIAGMIGGALVKLKEEIKKCDVRCANCHARKTAKQFSYYKYIK